MVRLSTARVARVQRGLTLLDLARITGIHDTKLSRLERGLRAARKHEADALARAVGSTVAALFNKQADGQFLVLGIDGAAATQTEHENACQERSLAH